MHNESSLSETYLASIIQHPELLEHTVGIVKSPDHFLTYNYRLIYASVLFHYDVGQPISIPSLANDTEKRGLKNPKATITALIEGNSSPSETAVIHAAREIANQYQKRQLHQMADTVSGQADDRATRAQDIIDGVDATLQGLADNDGNDVVGAGIIANTYAEAVQTGRVRTEDLISTHMPSLNRKIGGLFVGDMTMIAGIPSHGKTALAMGFMREAAANGHRCLYVALDETKKSIIQRAMSHDTGFDRVKFQSGNLTIDETASLLHSRDKIKSEAWDVCDTPRMTVMDIKGIARPLKRKKGLDLIVIDYAQQLTHNKGFDTENALFTEVSNGLKALAKELPCALVVVSQLIKIHEHRRPKLSDLRGTGTWSQDANCVLFVWRDTFKTPRDGEIIIEKQKQGPTGIVYCKYDPPKMKWYEESHRRQEIYE